MDMMITPILFVIVIAITAIIIFLSIKMISNKAIEKALDELSQDIKNEIRKNPTYTPFRDDTKAELFRNNVKKGILIVLLVMVVGIVMAFVEDFPIFIMLIVAGIFAIVIFVLIIKDSIVYASGDLYEIRAYCDHRIYGKYNTARVYYYNFETMMFECKVISNISVGRELKAGQYCYVIAKVKNGSLVAFDVSPKEYEMQF